MKRDEMVDLIEQYLLHEFFNGCPKDKNDAWDSHKSANNILDVIEKAGMLPPKRLVQYFNPEIVGENLVEENEWD